jgi:hypothetical protein
VTRAYERERDALIAYLDALLVTDPDLNIGNAARDYCTTNDIPAITWDIDDVVSQVTRNKQEVDQAAAAMEMIICIPDEAGALTTGTAKVTFRMSSAMDLTEVRASVSTAPTDTGSPLSDPLTFDINHNGSTILSTKLSIDATEDNSSTAATQPVISTSSLLDNAKITIDIDFIGATTSGAEAKIIMKGTRA